MSEAGLLAFASGEPALSSLQNQLPLPEGACVRNTFLEFVDDNDPWFISADPRRQKTDSFVDSSFGLGLQLEQHLRSRSTFRSCLSTHSEKPDSPRGITLGIAASADPIVDETVKYSCKAPLLNQQQTGNLLSQSGDTASDSMSAKQQSPHKQQQDALLGQACPSMAKTDQALMSEQLAELAVLPAIEPEPSCHRPTEEPIACSMSGDAHEYVDDASEVCDESTLESSTSNTDDVGNKSFHNKPKVINNELIAMREIAMKGGGLSGNTTVMIRYIPTKYTQQQLMREINCAGFLGKYDFFYCPSDLHRHGNRGFAFINFTTPENAGLYYNAFHGGRFQHYKSDAPLVVLPADRQGFEANAEQYARSRGNGRRRPLQCRALFFRPLPEHLTQGSQAEQAEQLDLQSETSPCTSTAVTSIDKSMCRQKVDGNPEAQAPVVPRPRFCAYCGQPKKQDHHKFCVYCGARSV